MMSIESTLKPNAAAKIAAERVSACNRVLEELEERRSKQKAVVAAILDQLKEIVIAHRWDTEKSTKGVEKARRECTEITAQLNREASLLGPTDMAYSSARHDLAVAKQRFAEISKEMIKEAALKEEPEAKNTLLAAMNDYFTCRFANGSIQSIGAAQYELEKLAQDQSWMLGVEKRVNSIHQNLYEQAAA